MEKLNAIFTNPAVRNTAIGAGVVAGVVGTAAVVDHYIGKPLSAGLKSFGQAFKTTFAENKAARAAAKAEAAKAELKAEVKK